MGIRDTWWARKWAEDHEKGNWEEARARKDDPEGVLAGIHRLRARSLVDAPIPMSLLDKDVNIGRSVEFDASSADEFVAILNLEADDKRSRLVTIHTVAGVVTGAFNGAESLEGRVEWGAGGVQSSITFDWLFGTTLNVVGSFVRVSVRRTSPLPAGVTVRAGAFAGYNGVGSKRTTPQLTIPMGLAVAGAAVNAEIPIYAKDVHISRVESGGGTVSPPAMTVHLMPALFVATTVASENYPAGVNQIRPMPIVPDATGVRVVNTDVVPMVVRATFGLAI